MTEQITLGTVPMTAQEMQNFRAVAQMLCARLDKIQPADSSHLVWEVDRFDLAMIEAYGIGLQGAARSIRKAGRGNYGP